MTPEEKLMVEYAVSISNRTMVAEMAVEEEDAAILDYTDSETTNDDRIDRDLNVELRVEGKKEIQLLR